MRLALVGPTASGKTGASLHIAEALGAHIVSADSMLVYRGMDVGTAKPTAQERARVPHHGIDLVDPRAAFSVAIYQQAATEAMAMIERAGARVLLVGGSGLYVRAVLDGLDFPPSDPVVRALLEAEGRILGADLLRARLERLDPAAADKIEPGNLRRVVRALEVPAITGQVFSSFATAWEHYPADGVRLAGVEVPREALVARIERRVEAMFAHGFVEEVRALTDAGAEGWLTSIQAIGYAEVSGYLRGESTLEEARVSTVRRTKALARRQMAWFRRDPRIRWFPAPEGAEAITDELTEYLAA